MRNTLNISLGAVKKIQFNTPDGLMVFLKDTNSNNSLYISGTIESIRYSEFQGITGPTANESAPFGRVLTQITLTEVSRETREYGLVIQALMQFHYADGVNPTSFLWRMSHDQHAISVDHVEARADGKAYGERMYISLR